MAIRIRDVNGRLRAFCAVETDEKPGDFARFYGRESLTPKGDA